jgi:hypothetical protein
MKPTYAVLFSLMVFSLALVLLSLFLIIRQNSQPSTEIHTTDVLLLPGEVFQFNSFVDCNMAEAWIGDTFRIFPGKYGEDPLWGDARDLKFADGQKAYEAFSASATDFTEPLLPVNVPPGKPGLHGAFWFETIYQNQHDPSGRTLYAIYHNENYPSTLPFDPETGEGYLDWNWPQGITGPESPAAVCRIGIMKSTDGGRSWKNMGIFIEDLQPRMILKPHNNSRTFAGGVGDPSAVASGDYLYLFYGEYGYPGIYQANTYNDSAEWNGQCISVARINLNDLDDPAGKAKRWDGRGFNAPFNGVGKPVAALQIARESGGGPASSSEGGFYWGPSVSWNTYLKAWVMLMAKSEGPSWEGSSIYISFNRHADLGRKDHSQQWTKPMLLMEKPGHTIWYPSLQPLNTREDIEYKHTCLRLGEEARLFFKYADKGEYVSEYRVRFVK